MKRKTNMKKKVRVAKVLNDTLSNHDIEQDCERSMRYHDARSRFFNAQYRVIQFTIFLLSGANIAGFTSVWLPYGSIDVAWAIVAVLAVFSLITNPAKNYMLHNRLSREFTDLHGKSEANPGADYTLRSEWVEKIHQLYNDEPPVYRALGALCHNQCCLALGADDKHLIKLRWYHLWFRNWIPFQTYDLPYKNEVK